MAVAALAVVGTVLVARPPDRPAPSSPPGSAADTRGAVPSEVTTVPVARVLALDASRPVSITIPSIGVRSVIRSLGLTATGALAVPAPGPHYDEVGWYSASPTPGEVGPSVLVGHVDSATTGPSVFWELATVRPGARVVVVRADRSVATFSVTRVSRFDKSTFPTEQVYGDTRAAVLRIITCGGPIDATTGHYRDDVVVFAELTAVRRP